MPVALFVEISQGIYGRAITLLTYVTIEMTVSSCKKFIQDGQMKQV